MRKIDLKKAPKISANVAFKSFPSGQNIYRNFNKGKYTRDQYKYSHICFNCQ